MKNSIKNFIIFILLFILFIYKDLFYLIPLSILKIDIEKLNYTLQTLLSILSSLIVVIILIIIYKKYLKEKIIDFKKHFGDYFDFGIKYWIIGVIGMALFNILINLLTPLKEANNEALVQNMLKEAPILTFISASFIAPFVEEMLFRKSLSDIFHNKKLAVLISGLVFGLLHVIFSMESPLDLLYVFPYGMLGASFAYILYKKDNIYVPIMFHVIHNGLLTLVSISLTFLSR